MIQFLYLIIQSQESHKICNLFMQNTGNSLLNVGGINLLQYQLLLIIHLISSMQINDANYMNAQIHQLIKSKVEVQCFMCLQQFDCEQYAPMIMCMNQHSCCAPCMRQFFKSQGSKQLSCPHCQQPINKKVVTKNKNLITIFQIITAFKKHVAVIEDELNFLRKMSITSNIQMKSSLLVKSTKMVSSFISNQSNNQKSPKILKKISFFDDSHSTKSQSRIQDPQKRRQLLLAYADREKIQALKNIAISDFALQQVQTIRSGYGTIKKIECMEYFINLRELLLYNNHIKSIEGLNSNIRLHVLSLAYNKIQKVENIGHLKELKRLSLECNKIGKTSAQYLAIYQWRNLQSLTISFHQENKQDNQICFAILFDSRSLIRWSNLKTLYIFNSKQLSEKTRAQVKQFGQKKKNPMQVYWS